MHCQGGDRGFGLRSTPVGAKPRSTGPRAPRLSLFRRGSQILDFIRVCGFLFYHNLCCLWLPLVTHGYHLWLRFKGFTSLFLIRFCKIVLQCHIRRITEELGGQYHIAAGIVYDLCYRITAEAVGTLYQILLNENPNPPAKLGRIV